MAQFPLDQTPIWAFISRLDDEAALLKALLEALEEAGAALNAMDASRLACANRQVALLGERHLALAVERDRHLADLSLTHSDNTLTALRSALRAEHPEAEGAVAERQTLLRGLAAEIRQRVTRNASASETAGELVSAALHRVRRHHPGLGATYTAGGQVQLGVGRRRVEEKG